MKCLFPSFPGCTKEIQLLPVSKDGQDYDEMIEEIDPVVKETETFHVLKTSPDEEAADMVYNFKKVNKSFSRR